jgi:hypothetical protein
MRSKERLSASFRRMRSVALLCLAAGVVGCKSPPRATDVPLCPVPSKEALRELESGQVPPGVEHYLGRVERLCAALEALQ